MADIELETIALALFDLAQNQRVFERLESCYSEHSVVKSETAQLRSASDSLEREIVALDQQRSSASKLLDASFPPEAKQAAEKVFTAKFEQYFGKTREILEKHLLDAHALEMETVRKLAAAQQIELEQIALLKKAAAET
jgi:transposase